MPISQRFNRALLHFNNLGLTDTVTLLEKSFSEPNVVSLAAVSECENIEDLLALTSLMQNMNLLRDMTEVAGRHELTPTAKGWLRIEELTTTPMNLPQGFVAMWLNETTQEAFEKGIEPAIANCGWKALRIDKKEHANNVVDETIAEIPRSRFVVADFTCGEDGVRGSVYYEAGFANGLRIPVIWTCHKDSLERLHFDTRQYSHVVWESPGELCTKLQARIGAVIGDGPLAKPR